VTDPGPLSLVIRVATILNELGIAYALGGSMASSFFGEPRATADIDVAISVDATAGDRLAGADAGGVLRAGGLRSCRHPVPHVVPFWQPNRD
jgi:hypothetical protein